MSSPLLSPNLLLLRSLFLELNRGLGAQDGWTGCLFSCGGLAKKGGRRAGALFLHDISRQIFLAAAVVTARSHVEQHVHGLTLLCWWPWRLLGTKKNKWGKKNFLRPRHGVGCNRQRIPRYKRELTDTRETLPFPFPRAEPLPLPFACTRADITHRAMRSVGPDKRAIYSSCTYCSLSPPRNCRRPTSAAPTALALALSGGVGHCKLNVDFDLF